jgi:uncharacterized membrane protein YdjX (TVP38/TMEM64 family)
MFDRSSGIAGGLQRLLEAERLRLRLAVQRASGRIALIAVAAVMGLFALAMLVLASFLALSRIYGPVGGALITAGGLVLVALLLALVAHRLGRTRSALAEEAVRLARADVAGDARRLELLLADLRQEAGAWPHRHARGLTIFAGLFGLAVGLSPRLRRLLLGREE